jgi:GTPase SAR1 family protein
VYDITNRDSFENIQHWLSEVDIYSTNSECVKLLIANKIDESDARAVSKKEGAAFARENNMLFIEASAKTQDGIAQAFEVSDSREDSGAQQSRAQCFEEFLLATARCASRPHVKCMMRCARVHR